MVSRRLPIRLLSALLALLLFPGWGELAENVEHLVHDGHLAHVAEHPAGEGEHHARSGHAGDRDEAPCSPTDHHCPCCVSLPSVEPPALPVALAPLLVPADDPTLPPYGGRSMTRPIPPPLRPPSA